MKLIEVSWTLADIDDSSLAQRAQMPNKSSKIGHRPHTSLLGFLAALLLLWSWKEIITSTCKKKLTNIHERYKNYTPFWQSCNNRELRIKTLEKIKSSDVHKNYEQGISIEIRCIPLDRSCDQIDSIEYEVKCLSVEC